MPRRRPLKRGDLVLVFWKDAAHKTHRVPGTFRVVTPGFFVDMDDEELHLTTDWFEDGEGRDYNSIPRGMVQKIRNYGAPAGVTDWEPINPDFAKES